VTDFGALVQALCTAEVRFVLVGGVAATLHGSARLTLASGLNFTPTTSAGDIDLLGEIAGAGSYDTMISHTVDVELFGARCRCLDLPTLIAAKIASGRPKDLEAIAELRALLDERPPES